MVRPSNPGKKLVRLLVSRQGEGESRRLRSRVTAAEVAEAVALLRTYCPDADADLLDRRRSHELCRKVLAKSLAPDHTPHPDQDWDLVSIYAMLREMKRGDACVELGLGAKVGGAGGTGAPTSWEGLQAVLRPPSENADSLDRHVKSKLRRDLPAPESRRLDEGLEELARTREVLHWARRRGDSRLIEKARRSLEILEKCLVDSFGRKDDRPPVAPVAETPPVQVRMTGKRTRWDAAIFGRLLTLTGKRRVCSRIELEKAIRRVSRLCPDTNWMKPWIVSETVRHVLRQVLKKTAKAELLDNRFFRAAGFDLVGRYMEETHLTKREDALHALGLPVPPKPPQEPPKPPTP